MLQIYSIPNLEYINEINVTNQPITMIRYSNDGNIFVAATLEKILVYSLTEGVWVSLGEILLPLSLISMDLSSDNTLLRYLCGEYNEIFNIINITNNNPDKPFGDDIKNKETLSTVTWASNFCPCHWDSKGVWDNIENAIDMSITDRSNNLFVQVIPNGYLNLKRVPIIDYGKSPYTPVLGSVKLAAHNGTISSFVFIEEGTKLVTAGTDGLIKVWKVTYDIEEVEPDTIGGDDDIPIEEDNETKKEELAFYDSADDEDLIDGTTLINHLSEQVITNDKMSALHPWATNLGINIDNISNNTVQESVIPNDEFELEWAYGYTSRVARNCVKYTYDGKIIYPAASMGVIYDKVTQKQTFAMGHYDEITCLDVHVPTSIAVTANKGAGNILACVWSTDNGKILNRLNCGVVNAVSAITFSPDGTLIAVACQDPDHTIKLFHWQSGLLKASTIGGQKKVLCLSFSNITNGNVCRILQGGEKHFQFLELINNRSFITKQGKYGTGIKKSNILCIVSLSLALSAEGGGNEFLIGMSDGTIGIIPRNDRRVTSFISIQKGSITSICIIKIKDATIEEGPQFKIVSAGTDGQIKILDQELQPITEYNLYKKDKYGLYGMGKLRGIKSLCIDKANRKIMYGTTAGEIGEISIENGSNINDDTNLLVNGHFRDQLHSLSSNPVRQECVTAGDDKTLRIWDLETHNMKTMIELPGNARAVSFSPNGQTIIVGLGGALSGAFRSNMALNNGRIVVVSYLQGVLNIVHTAKNAENAITSIVFTPDGSIAYISSLDCNIYVYDVLDNFNLKHTLKLHTEGIKSLDVSTDARFLLSVGYQGEVILWSLDSHTPIQDTNRITILPNIEWFNRQNTCGIDTIGIFVSNSKYSDVLTYCRSKDKSICVTGDIYGNIKLFSNPTAAVSINAPYKIYTGHTSGGVAKITFSRHDKFLLSIGQDDKVLLQWSVKKSTAINTTPTTIVPTTITTTTIVPTTIVTDNIFDDSFTIDGVNFIDNQKVSTKTVNEKLLVSSIIGLGAKTISGNIIDHANYCGAGDIVTNCGKLLYSIKSDKITQHQWQYHENETITCITISSCGMLTLVSSNNNDNNNGILRLYNSSTGYAIVLLSDDINGGITSCTISKDNNMIACLSNDDQHSLYVFTNTNKEWNNDSILLFSGAISNKRTMFVGFLEMSGAADDFALVTAGDDNIKFWTIKGRNLHYTIGDVYLKPNDAPNAATNATNAPNAANDDANANADANAEPIVPEVLQPITTLIPINKVQSIVVGDATGSLWLWTGSIRQGLIGSHNSPITALKAIKDGFITASCDVIKVWKDGYWIQIEREYSLVSIIERIKRIEYVPDIGSVCSIDADFFNRRLLLTYTWGLLVEIAMDSEAVTILAEGFASQITMMTPHPTEAHTIATLHDDRTLKVIDLSSSRRGPTAAIKLFQLPTAMTFIDNKILIVGVIGQDNADSNGSSLLVLELGDATTDAQLSVPGPYCQQSKASLDRPITMVNKVLNIGKGTITKITPSPDKSKVAICNSDKKVYIYDIADNSSASNLTMGNDEIPVSADFSSCSKYLRVFSQYSDLSKKVTVCYYNVTNGSQITGSGLEEMKTVVWATVSSPAAPEARGVMSSTTNITDMSSLGDRKIVGYADGSVKSFKGDIYTPVDTPASSSLSITSPGRILVALLADGKHLAVTRNGDSYATVYKISSE